MTWSPSNPAVDDANTANNVIATLDAALTGYANAIQPEVGVSFLGIIWTAYQTLHSAVRKKVRDEFGALQGTGYYHNSFTKAVWSTNPLFRSFHGFLGDGGDAFNALVTEYVAQMQVDAAMLQSSGSSSLTAMSSLGADIVTDSYYFFASPSIFGQFSDQLAKYESDTAALLQMAVDEVGVASASTAITPFQEAALNLLFVPFGLQAIYSALSARDLYEIDGNVGARAAAVKLGAIITGESAGAPSEPDLLGLQSTVGGLTGYITALWAVLGATLPDSVSDAVDLSEPSTLADLTNFALVLLYAEVGDKVALPGTDTKFRPDGLGAWKAPRSYTDPEHPGTVINTANAELTVAVHVLNASTALQTTDQGAAVSFSPTWLALLSSPTTLGYTLSNINNVPNNPNVLYAHPLAHLCLFVAARLFARSRSYVVVPLATGGQNNPPALPGIRIPAACLEFGGKHHPHNTHRSGYELDISIHNGQLRALEMLPPPTGSSLKVIQAITGGSSDIPADYFDPQQYDWYGKHAAKDKPRNVAIARSLELSLYLSGCSRVISTDPWLFIDVFSFLRSGFAHWKQLVHAAHQTLPTHFGDSAIYLAGVRLAVVRPHWDHWHGEWAIPHNNAGLISLDTDFLRKWVPVWSALQIERDDLINVLNDLLVKSNPSDSTKQLIETMTGQINQYYATGLPSLYTSLYVGPQGQNWLNTTPIHGLPTQ